MKTGNNGINLIKQFEGCKLASYQDVVGIWTIGYGATGPDVKKGILWTQEQCEDRLRSDLSRFEKAVNNIIKVPINQNQFDALICFTYNVGIGSLTNSTLAKKINANDMPGAANEFVRWNKAGGKEVAGLTRRRLAEKDLFNKSTEVESKQEKISSGPSEDDINKTLENIEKGLIG